MTSLLYVSFPTSPGQPVMAWWVDGPVLPLMSETMKPPLDISREEVCLAPIPVGPAFLRTFSKVDTRGRATCRPAWADSRQSVLC